LEEVYDLGELSPYEEAGLKAMIPELQASIQKGIDFVAQS
jgi:malate dehydrogenase